MSTVPTMDLGDDEPPQAESFETAKPVAKAPAGRRPVQPLAQDVRTPDEPDPEAHLLGCLLIDEGATLAKAIDAGLSTTDFLDRRNGTIYAAIRQLHDNGERLALDTLIQALGPRLEQVGGLPRLMEIDHQTTTAHAERTLQGVIDASDRRRLERIAKQVQELTQKGGDLAEIAALLEQAKRRERRTTHVRTPFSFQIPPKDDRSILLGNRYLNRGDGMVVSSSSGMGKSSMSHQMASDWALGEDFFGINPNGALRILIVQSEDSDGDIAEVWQSLKHVRKYTPDQLAKLEKNIRIISERSLRGVKFLNWLKGEVAAFSPDLVILNPLQAFIDGDVTDSKDLGFFLREGLNGMNKDSAFGWIIIHHTTKPATGKDKAERLWHEVMYDMAGGAEIINWARGIISIRALEEPGKFRAVLAKRGRRAGVTKEVEQGTGVRLEIVTEIGLQHAQGFLPGTSTGIICWEPYALPEKSAPAGKSAGRPEKHKFTDFKSVFPKKTSPGQPFNEILRLCMTEAGGIQKGSLQGVLNRWAEHGDIEIIRPESGPTRYRAAL